MIQPAVWANDPECGHHVTCAFQTHYCSYIRVPRLLTLQPQDSLDELLLVTVFQWSELWFKVVLKDFEALLEDQGRTFESIKLLRRGTRIFKLLVLQFDFAEEVIIRELGLHRTLRLIQPSAISNQLSQLTNLSRRLAHFSESKSEDLRLELKEYLTYGNASRVRFQRFARKILHPKNAGVPSYTDWLHLTQLIDLQQGVKAAWAERGQSPSALMKPKHISADENMFIIVHQCFELWFKVILDHVDRSISMLQRGRLRPATRCVRRIVQIQRLLVQQIQIPATMLPLDFARFREEQLHQNGKILSRGLSPASGTESYQFREIEIACGMRDDPVYRNFLQGSPKLPVQLLTSRQSERLEQLSLAEAFRIAVQERGIEKYDDLFTPSNVPNPNADLAELGDTLIEFDEAFHFWRLGHVSMVEKMIGAKSGTGFLGPEYLMETAGIKLQEKNRVFEEKQMRPRFFEELWRVRTRIGTE